MKNKKPDYIITYLDRNGLDRGTIVADATEKLEKGLIFALGRIGGSVMGSNQMQVKYENHAYNVRMGRYIGTIWLSYEGKDIEFPKDLHKKLLKG